MDRCRHGPDLERRVRLRAAAPAVSALRFSLRELSMRGEGRMSRIALGQYLSPLRFAQSLQGEQQRDRAVAQLDATGGRARMTGRKVARSVFP